MWIYAPTMATELFKRLDALLDELRLRAPDDPAPSASHDILDTDFSTWARLTVDTLGPQTLVEVVAAFDVPRGGKLVPQPDWYGGHDTAWLVARPARGEDLLAVPGGARFLLPMGDRPAPDPADLFGLKAQRCGCRPDEGSTCGGPPDLVRVVDRAGEWVFGCSTHAIEVLVRLTGGRAEPGSTAGYPPEALAEAARSVKTSADYRSKDAEPGHLRLAAALGRFGDGPIMAG